MLTMLSQLILLHPGGLLIQHPLVHKVGLSICRDLIRLHAALALVSLNLLHRIWAESRNVLWLLFVWMSCNLQMMLL